MITISSTCTDTKIKNGSCSRYLTASSTDFPWHGTIKGLGLGCWSQKTTAQHTRLTSPLERHLVAGTASLSHKGITTVQHKTRRQAQWFCIHESYVVQFGQTSMTGLVPWLPNTHFFNVALSLYTSRVYIWLTQGTNSVPYHCHGIHWPTTPKNTFRWSVMTGHHQAQPAPIHGCYGTLELSKAPNLRAERVEDFASKT